MNAICLVMDRLHGGFLGPYGNTWIETPAMDRLAAESFVFDQALIGSPRLESLYRSYWQGWHALGGPLPEGRPALPTLLREAGVNTALATDEPRLKQHPLAVEFDDLVEIDPPWQAQVAGAGQFEQTHLARCFVEIIDWLQGTPGPFFLWCHLASLGTIWDAPLEFRRRYWDEGDPEPPATADVPDRMLADDADPDEVWGRVQAYAGQVTLLDTCLGAMLESLRESPAAGDTMFILTSARGFPLGEHRRLGPCDEALYSELVQVPLIVRMPGGAGAADRSPALVEPADLWATLLDGWKISDVPFSLMPVVRREAAAVRDRLCLAGRGAERAVRTPAWHLRIAEQPELFVKPDDRWDVNNVASRCQDVVEALQGVGRRYEEALAAGRPAELPPLERVLVEGLE